MKDKRSKGYTLLIAIIVSTILLAEAAFIVNIIRKQFILTSSSRDSTVAIYAADSGVQCIVEAFKNNTLTPATIGGTEAVPAFSCGNASNIQPIYSSLSNSPAGLNFRDSTTNPTGLLSTTGDIIVNFGNTCAILAITDGTDNQSGVNYGSHMTVIDARGYNVSCSTGAGGGPLPGPRDEERAIQLIYHG